MKHSFSSIESVYAYLDNLPRFSESGMDAADFDLGRFKKFCRAMGDPQEQFRSVHVAGSNGKGSTCRFLASVYQEAGYRVGLYTSPHLFDYRERFHINGEQIEEEVLLSFFREHASLIGTIPITYFELSTAVAFWWFADAGVDLAVIETGLGGRLDATNLVDPEVSVITSVSLDHTDILGTTLEDIAREKAGIIKKGTPVVLGKLPPAARQVIEDRAGEMQSPLHYIDSLEPEWLGDRVRIVDSGTVIDLDIGINVPVQAYNVAAARLAVNLLADIRPNSLSVTPEAFRKGIGAAHPRYPFRARFERICGDRDWYFDGAHNPEAVRALKEATETVGAVSEATLVLSLMRDKMTPRLIEEFSEFKKIFYYALATDRAADLEEIESFFPEVEPVPAKSQELTLFLKEFASELVIFAGSFYFYPTVSDWVRSEANTC